MRKNRFFTGVLLGLLCSFGFTSCESEGNTDQVITFEDVDLGETGHWNGSDLSGTSSSYESYGQTITEYTGNFVSGDLTCDNIYNASWYSWSGMACSSHHDMDSIGYGNQYSVYATSGAGGSKNFAIIYNWGSSTCRFNQEVEIKSLMINNSTYTYKAIAEGKDGTGMSEKFTTGDYYYMTIIGYDANGLKTDSVDYYLADFRGDRTYICKNWTKVPLSALGKIKSLSFKLTSSDIYTPTYVCIDNIVYKK